MRVASCSAELRAAASLRAASFAEYHEADRSEYSLQVLLTPACVEADALHTPAHVGEHNMQAYRRMKADAEWDVLEAKVAGRDAPFQVQD